MAKIEQTQIGNLFIEGYSGDYVYETIKKSSYYYEGGLLEKWLPSLRTSKIIFDIGANLGNHTLFWATHLSYKKIFSFEPFALNYERLCNNIAKNSLKNVFPVCEAVGSKKGYTSVSEFHEENYGGTTLNSEVSETAGEIKITDIDSFCQENGISHVDFIKIDTEGFELSVLDGMQSSLENSYPDLWIEVSAQSFSDVMERLRRLDYVLLDMEGFNLLFLNRKRHGNVESVKTEAVIADSLHNLERVNIYYKNYTTVKSWLASKNHSLEQQEQALTEQKNINVSLNEALKTSNEKYKKALANYNTMKIWHESGIKEIEKLKSELEELRNLMKKMEEQLSGCFEDYDFNIAKMEQLSRMLTRLEIQNSTLAQKNNEQKAILDKIDHNFFGRLAIKLYHLYQRYFQK